MVGAVVLLAWLGTGGERTDIVAHLTGFLAGFGMGAVLGRVVRLRAAAPMRQWLLGAVSVRGEYPARAQPAAASASAIRRSAAPQTVYL